MKQRVLIVDDDRSIRESLSKVLMEENYEVVLAADGQEALEIFSSGRVDLLLLDLGLPIKNGWDTFERITRENPLMPIIIITGQANHYDVALAAGVGALMEKPLDASKLLQTMRELLAESNTTRLQRLCGCGGDVRYLPRDSTRFLQKLRERHPAPSGFRLTNKRMR